MSTYIHSSASHINPRATLALCDACHEHAPAFVTGTARLCPSCAVASDLSAMPAIAARQLQDALIRWISTPNAWLDVDDETWETRMQTKHVWSQHDLDMEAERSARKAWVASVTADPEPSQVDLDAAFMAEFWAALIGEMAA